MIDKDILKVVAESFAKEYGVSYRDALMEISKQEQRFREPALEMLAWLDAEQEVENLCSKWNL